MHVIGLKIARDRMNRCEKSVSRTWTNRYPSRKKYTKKANKSNSVLSITTLYNTNRGIHYSEGDNEWRTTIGRTNTAVYRRTAPTRKYSVTVIWYRHWNWYPSRNFLQFMYKILLVDSQNTVWCVSAHFNAITFRTWDNILSLYTF